MSRETQNHAASATSAAPEADPVDPGPADGEPRYVRVDDLRPEDYDGTCLRPLGLCELGGCCDVCWYRHDHPRFKSHG